MERIPASKQWLIGIVAAEYDTHLNILVESFIRQAVALSHIPLRIKVPSACSKPRCHETPFDAQPLKHALWEHRVRRPGIHESVHRFHSFSVGAPHPHRPEEFSHAKDS